MATITISNAAYNNAKLFADKQNMGVDEFIVTLINKLTYPTKDKKKFNLLPMEQMESARHRAPQSQERHVLHRDLRLHAASCGFIRDERDDGGISRYLL